MGMSDSSLVAVPKIPKNRFNPKGRPVFFKVKSPGYSHLEEYECQTKADKCPFEIGELIEVEHAGIGVVGFAERIESTSDKARFRFRALDPSNYSPEFESSEMRCVAYPSRPSKLLVNAIREAKEQYTKRLDDIAESLTNEHFGTCARSVRNLSIDAADEFDKILMLK